MSDMKDYLKEGHSGKSSTDLIAVNEYLDNEIENLSKKLDTAQAKGIKSMRFRLISDEIHLLNTSDGEILMVGIVSLDGKYYGGFYVPPRQLNTPYGPVWQQGKQMVEELLVKPRMTPSPTTILGSTLIADMTEWHVIAQYFIDQKVYETARIVNWAYSAKTLQQVLSLAPGIVGLDDINKRLRKKHRKELTPMDLVQQSIKNAGPPKTIH